MEQRQEYKFTPRLMIDLDIEAQGVARRNFPRTPYWNGDIHKVTGADVRARARLGPREEIHVLIGGPPCQGFSFLGKRALDDERNVLLLDFLRLVKELRPFAVLIENVPLIVSSHNGQIIREVCDSLAGMGYSSCADVIAASDFGVPQLRRRAFVLAYRADLGLTPTLPTRTHERITYASKMLIAEKRVRFENSKLPYVSVEDAIGDLPVLKAGKGDEVMFYTSAAANAFQEWARKGSIAVFNHKSRSHSLGFQKKISVIEEGGSNLDLPAEQRFSDEYYSQAYARLHRHGIAQTITTSFANPGSGRFTHYSELRSITVREAARLQGFPDTFVFDSGQQTQMRHVGNAVPPLLAGIFREHIANDLLNASVHVAGTTKIKRKVAPEEPEQRSRVMRAVTSKDSAAELALRKELRTLGIRGYRLHAKDVAGKPDLVFRRDKLLVFVDGCFWHGCPTCYRAPRANSEYWSMKAERNRARDLKNTEECTSGGWRVLRFWEHAIVQSASSVAANIRAALAAGRSRKRAPRHRAA
jgi:DNA mismatch endonuclease Vsr